MSTRRFAPLLALLASFALTGCATIETHLGMRVYIAKLPVTTMQAELPPLPAGNPGIAPGGRRRIVATFTDTNGKTWVTEGKGKGKILWKDITVTTTVVTAKKGVLSLAQDPRVSDGKIGHVALTVPSHPTLHSEFDVPVRYDFPFKAAFAGSYGSSGTNGSDGTSGSNGTDGSTDPNNPSAGGNGGNGTSGSNGGNGSDGGDGPNVSVLVTLHPGPIPLLECSVSAGSRPTFYLVDPTNGSITITSSGGSGGAAGKGGKGGAGGSGGIGSPPGMSGSSGSDGSDGMSGSNGRPGTVSIAYDPGVEPYLSAIHASPSPTMTKQPIPPLW